MSLLRVAMVTEKATGHRYEVYAVASESDPAISYPVWTNTSMSSAKRSV